jgi:hypothetical protein
VKFPAAYHAALAGVKEPQQALEERCFTGAVFPYDAELFPGLDGKIEVPDSGKAVIGKGEIFAAEQYHAVMIPEKKNSVNVKIKPVFILRLFQNFSFGTATLK